MSDDPVVRKGEKVTCTNGHVICEAIEDVWPHSMNWGALFGNWTQPEIMTGSMTVPHCDQCGAEFIKPKTWQMHFEDGTWRPEPPKQ